MKTDAPTPSFAEALRRVLGMQDKLHRWSKRDATARFADLFNLVADPAFLALLTDPWVRSGRGGLVGGRRG